MNPGDPVLLEAPLYAGVLPYLQVINAEMVGKSNVAQIGGKPLTIKRSE
jgi:hypothetical protein